MRFFVQFGGNRFRSYDRGGYVLVVTKNKVFSLFADGTVEHTTALYDEVDCSEYIKNKIWQELR